MVKLLAEKILASTFAVLSSDFDNCVYSILYHAHSWTIYKILSIFSYEFECHLPEGSTKGRSISSSPCKIKHVAFRFFKMYIFHS